jgi:subtilisin family serine protease
LQAQTGLIPGSLIVEWDNGQIEFLQLDTIPESADAWLKNFRRRRGVKAAQWDYQLEFRGTPDDPDYKSQWSLPHIGANKVWDFTKGGVTITGDTIVVAVLDRGFDTEHVELSENLWRNRAEIPGDGLDNDGNGYTDDYHGWNFADNSPDYSPDDHGTAVAGIIGAKGNNRQGISGINWNVKMMLLTAGKVSDVIKACQYIINQRELYNTSGGKRGAFVVVTNASFGISGVFCREQPVWGAMFDKLGLAGILTVAATTNSPVNVDTAGDMPATCTSPFLIAALSSDQNDQRQSSSGFGVVSIDIGAPGVQIYTTFSGDQYDNFSGTSAAAPHVSGAVALLYSQACENLMLSARNAPQQAALSVRQAILEGAAKAPGLIGSCAGGARLSISGSMDFLNLSCSSPSETSLINISRIFPNPARDGIVVEYSAPDPFPVSWTITNVTGKVMKQQIQSGPNPWPLKQLFIPLQDLPGGAYTFNLTIGNTTRSQWFIRL